MAFGTIVSKMIASIDADIVQLWLDEYQDKSELIGIALDADNSPLKTLIIWRLSVSYVQQLTIDDIHIGISDIDFTYRGHRYVVPIPDILDRLRRAIDYSTMAAATVGARLVERSYAVQVRDIQTALDAVKIENEAAEKREAMYRRRAARHSKRISDWDLH